MKGILIYTDDGIKLLGSFESEDGKVWDRETCFKYCNYSNKVVDCYHQSYKLKALSTMIDPKKKKDRDWFRNIENFKTVGITITHSADQLDKETNL